MKNYQNTGAGSNCIVPDPFIQLTPKNAHVKFLIWGGPGTGKTVWSLSGEKVAYVSLESGADRYSSLNISAFFPKNLFELGQALRFLINTENDYQTVVIDSISVAWGMFMEELIPEGSKPDWVMVKTRWKRFLRTLLSLQKDVILIGRSKEARSDSAWYKKTGDLILDSEASTGFEFDFVGFSYITENEERAKLEFKIKLEKVRDLTGRVTTGMVLTNSTFKDFKFRLNNLLIQNSVKANSAESFIHQARQSKQGNPENLKARDDFEPDKNGQMNISLMRNQLREVMAVMNLRTEKAQVNFCQDVLASNKRKKNLHKIDDLSITELSLILKSSQALEASSPQIN